VTWVNDTGTNIVFAKDTDDMIIHILSLKRRLDAIWKTAFQRDEELGHGLRESFETFMNKTKKGDATWGTDNSKVGEMIAKYVDQLLRGGAKAIPEVLTAKRNSISEGAALPVVADEDNNGDEDMDEDAEINIQLDQVLDLFRFVHGKAVFEAFYKKDLARRLLMGRSASADAERSMLSRLKTECGSGFTQNLEQMFKDVELGREEMQSYKQRLEEREGYSKGKNIELNVNILSAAAWPTYPDIPVVVPANVKKAIDDFELHYKSKHSGRKLDWKHALAHCQMRATFGKTTKELVVSSFQAVVLLLFNAVAEGEHLTYSHILNESGLRKYNDTADMPWNIHNTNIPPSRTRSKTHTSIPRLRQTAPPHQTPQRQRHLLHRHLHLQPGLHPPQIPRQNQPSPAQRNQRRKQRNAHARGGGPQFRDAGGDCADYEEQEDDWAFGACE
jgi:cullin-4